jgi:predicted nucleic acid-binding protein
MPVVSNTSPISNLAIIGRLDLLRSQFGEILIPGAVQQELAQLHHVVPLRTILQALDDGWIIVRPAQDDRIVQLLLTSLHQGEAEAIALALEWSADAVLLDEREGRAVATSAGLRVTGVLGVLLRAKSDGQIDAVKPELEALRHAARFFVSPNLERQFLQIAGE